MNLVTTHNRHNALTLAVKKAGSPLVDGMISRNFSNAAAVKVLLAAGADPSKLGGGGKSPFFVSFLLFIFSQFD